MPKRVLLIDGDIVAYFIACSCETPIAFSPVQDNGKQETTADPKEAEAAVRHYIERLLIDLKADRAVVCMSDIRRYYFRHDVYPQYKQNRTSGEPPKLLDFVKQTLRDGIKMEEVESRAIPRMEADDVMGIMATAPALTGNAETIICTNDKDLRQIPGKYYRISPSGTLPSKIEDISESNGDYFFWTQTLTGDPTDGYPGCEGIGPKKAEKILIEALSHDKAGSLVWPAIVAAYERKYGDEGEEKALVQARVARILRASDYDFEKREIKLWTPATPSLSASSPAD
jgi:DNA polymerase-1